MAGILTVFKLISLLFLIQIGTATEGIQPLIISGVLAKIEEAPYYAGLYDCGAVILSDSWVLTAAHCVERPKPPQYRFVWVGGETFATSKKIQYNQVIIFEGYSSQIGVILHDIALLKLASPLKFTEKIQPIKLPTGPNEYRNLMVVGRGIDETGNSSKNLKKINLLGLSTEECISIIPDRYKSFVIQNWKIFELANVCAKTSTGRASICSGDSGGPLVSKDSLVGLVSYIGIKHCNEARIGFYTNVTSYVPWIRRHTGL